MSERSVDAALRRDPARIKPVSQPTTDRRKRCSQSALPHSAKTTSPASAPPNCSSPSESSHHLRGKNDYAITGSNGIRTLLDRQQLLHHSREVGKGRNPTEGIMKLQVKAV
jgi:hypothetical protein